MPTETQQHPLVNASLSISRNGRHQYWVDDGPKVSSVTSLTAHVDGDKFGVGVNWAVKLVRDSGDLEAPKRMSQESASIGTVLHNDIDRFIKTGAIAENPLFSAWYSTIGQRFDWVASEIFIYHPTELFGGTIDAISLNPNDSGGCIVWDWKTKERPSYEKYGGYLHEQAQIAGYAAALRAMGSVYIPTKACIGYIMRDGLSTDTVDVDLPYATRLFMLSKELHSMGKAQPFTNHQYTEVGSEAAWSLTR